MDGQDGGLSARLDQPLIGMIVKENGQDLVRYFVNEEASEATTRADCVQRALSIAGAWSDLAWGEMEKELARIRHESLPTPPITDP